MSVAAMGHTAIVAAAPDVSVPDVDADEFVQVMGNARRRRGRAPTDRNRVAWSTVRVRLMNLFRGERCCRQVDRPNTGASYELL